jgi:hypothetical protein
MRDDMVGKAFVKFSTNGDLPTNPMSLRECLNCGGVFTRDESREHSDAPCRSSPLQSLALVTGRESKSKLKHQICQ